MYKTKLSLLAVLVGVVLMGAGCVKSDTSTNTDAVVAPTQGQPSSEPAGGSLPTSAPAASSASEPASKPTDTAPAKSEPSTAPDQPTQSAPVPTPQSTPAPMPAPAPAPEPAPAPKKVSAAIAGFSFQPNSITISVGDTITWTNNDGAPHTVTAGEGSFDSGALSSGRTFSKTFTTAGTYSYVCNFHGSMHGTVIVK
ncbi:MAG: cupredoxin family copper-binding protein [Candidatus Magasanikbacteria bacterium]|nr:cupredoxin family copper-binding protein [Candidatus Magasanikbacteria bacterium]